MRIWYSSPSVAFFHETCNYLTNIYPSCTKSQLSYTWVVQFPKFLQSAISLQDFQDAEPDVLVHSTSAILERFTENEMRCNVALKALCKKKGLHVEVRKFFLNARSSSGHLFVLVIYWWYAPYVVPITFCHFDLSCLTFVDVIFGLNTST